MDQVILTTNEIPEANDAEVLLREAESFTVSTQDDVARISELAKRVKQTGKTIEEKMKSMTDPANGFIKSVREIFKPKLEMLSKVETICKSHILKYQQEVERLRREEEKKIEAERKRIEDEKIARWAEESDRRLAEGKKEAPAPIIQPVRVQVQAQAKTIGASTVRKVKKMRITDANLIPREYMVPDLQKIEAVLKSGVSVPGAEIYEDQVISIR